MPNTTSNTTRQSRGGVLLATLLLPGLAALGALAPRHASAENAPEKSTVAVKYGHYSDSQPGLERIKVNAPHVYLQTPIAGDWALEGALVSDSVSGASPRLHTQRSGASRMSDERHAADVKVTRYLSRAALSAGIAWSDEHDYTSRAASVDARWSSADNNRTWSLGYGQARDTIDNQASGVNTAINQHRRTHELMGGLTQVLTPTDIAQFNLTRSSGNGYYNDPYKLFDQRPGARRAWIGLARWNHALERGAALRASYRYYGDTFGVRAHTAGLEWVRPSGPWTVTPGARYTTQSAARFYVDPRFDAQGNYAEMATIVAAASRPGEQSSDQRLAAYGALTLSIKVSYALGADTALDAKLEAYRQSSGLRLGGAGSPGLDPLRARFLQLGLTHRF